MERRCNHCGALVKESDAICPLCGKPVNRVKPAPKLNVNIYTLGALALATLLLLLCAITGFMDSCTIFNRMYCTALEWNIPLATIALIVIGFAVCSKEGKSQLLNLALVGILAVAFILSNTTKNTIQAFVSNADNYVNIAAEAMDDEADNVVDWMETLEESAEDAQKTIQKGLERKRKEEAKKNRNRNYNEYTYEDGEAAYDW